jgi:hypothetical protein
MRKKFSSDNSGVFALGYIQNTGSYLSEISTLAKTTITAKDLDRNIKTAYDAQKEINYYYDANGDLMSGAFSDERTSRYAIETGFMAPNPNPAYPPDMIYAVFAKDSFGRWTGVRFFIKYRLERYHNAYRFGNISFRDFAEANTFIKELESSLLPGETWKFKSNGTADYRPKTEYDILESYLHYIFEKLLNDNNDPTSRNHKKIIFSADQKYALFNSGLLNKFAQDVYILGEVYGDVNGKFTLSNPIVAGGKVELMRKYNFESAALASFPSVVEFFHNLDDIIYDSDVEIDLNFDNLSHIIEDGAKRNRFTEKYTVLYEKGDLPAITSTLTAAIENARKIAKRNYKYVVPQYRSARRGEPGKIQFLMPIYLDRQYGERPDFALVLNIEVMSDGSRFYTPETILELSWAYNNARVICKPEDTWLNPATIDSLSFEESIDIDTVE